MARKDIHKDGVKTQFSSTNQPAHSGRRPSVFAKYIRENRVSLDDIRALISSLLGYDAAEIEAALKDKVDKPPVAILLMLKAIKADIDKGETTNFDKLVDRAFGKPEKTVNHEIGAVSPAVLAMLDGVFAQEPKANKKKLKTNARKPRTKKD